MDKIRTDKLTGKKYTHDNIPIGRVYAVSNLNGKFRIIELNESQPENSWYNGIFIGRAWAVFKYNEDMQGYQQISRWYYRFGDAQRYLLGKC